MASDSLGGHCARPPYFLLLVAGTYLAPPPLHCMDRSCRPFSNCARRQQQQPRQRQQQRRREQRAPPPAGVPSSAGNALRSVAELGTKQEATGVFAGLTSFLTAHMQAIHSIVTIFPWPFYFLVRPLQRA